METWLSSASVTREVSAAGAMDASASMFEVEDFRLDPFLLLGLWFLFPEGAVVGVQTELSSHRSSDFLIINSKVLESMVLPTRAQRIFAKPLIRLVRVPPSNW